MKLIWPILTVLAFFGGCTASLRPIWFIAERRWIEPIVQGVPDDFPVLAHGTSDQSVYRVIRWQDISNSVPVTTINEIDEGEINRQLRASISTKPSRYKYFRILDRAENRIDVSLEIPTFHESRTRSWYRIEDGVVLPQKMMTYGPGFAFVVLPFSLMAGAAAVFLFRVVTKRFRNRTTDPGKEHQSTKSRTCASSGTR